MQIGEYEITSDVYEKWLKHLTIWFNNSGRAEETLERHLDNVQRLYNEGGILYRLMFLEKSETIDKNNLGQHWVADENVLEDIRSMLLDTARGEKDPDYEYTITIKIPPKNVNIQDSISEFLANPNEEEIWLDTTKNAKIQDIQKAPIAEMIVRRRFAKLTESSTFIASIPEVNMKEYAKAAIRDIFIQMPTRSVNLNNWHGYKQYVEGYFGNNSYKVAMKELKEDGWLTKGETRYEWKKAYGPVGTFPKKDHLNEWADFIKYHDNTGKEKHLDIDDKKAFPFGYQKDTDKLVVGRPDATHFQSNINAELDDYTGRIWPTQNVISFWKYPETKSKLLRIIKDLNSMLPTKRWYKAGKITNRWKIDVPNVAKNVKTLDMNNIYNYGLFSSLVPIKNWEPDMISNHRDFKRELKKQQQKHLQSPMNKKDINVPVGIGSKKTPAGFSSTQRHQMKSTSEIKEWADEIHIKGKHTLLHYTDLDAYPFVFHIKENKAYIGQEGQSHAYSIETDVYWKNQGGIAGRIWGDEKIISFWEYPDNVAMYKNLIAQLNKSIVEKNKEEGLDIPKVTSSWKIDIPDTTINLMVGNDFWHRVKQMPGGEDGYKNIKSNLIPVFDWDPKIVKNPKNYMKQMEKRRGVHMLSPIAKNVMTGKGIGSKKTPVGLSATQRHQMKSTSEELMNEHPDNIENTALRFGNRGAFTFGYINQRLWVGDNTHRSLHVDGDTGIPRKEFEHGGRIWVAEKIMSFWAYPDDSYKMKHICNDLSKWFKSGWEKDKENIENSSSSQFVGRTYDIWNTFNVEIIVSEKGTIDVDVKYNQNNEITTENRVNHIIPVKDYVSSEERSSDELAIQHVLSPMQKSGKELPYGIGSTKTLAGLTPTKYHQLRRTSEDIDEWADSAIVGDKELEWDDRDAFAFGFDDNSHKFQISPPRQTHGYIGANEYNDNYIRGRYWTKSKVLAFWVYPKDQHDMQRLIKLINDTKGQKIINNTWKVEIPMLDKDISNPLGNRIGGLKRGNSIVIPIEDFDSEIIENPVEWKQHAQKQLQLHVLSPMVKKSKFVAGVGSNKTPAGLSATQRHQIKSTSEGIKLVESPDYVHLNTGEEIEYQDDDAYGFYFLEDELYISNDPGQTHGEGVYRSGKYNSDEIRTIQQGNPVYGRIWVDSQMLSFWNPPTSRKEMADLSDKLSDNFENDIDVWDDFEVEIYDGDNVIIPVKSYKSSEAAPDEEYQRHLLSPAKKKGIKVPMGVGSNKTPVGLSATQRHQMKSTSENTLNEIKTEYGCLMLKIEFPWWRNFTEKYIKDEDIYNNAAQDFGREYKAHITVLYGFTENIDVEKMKKMLYTLKRPISVELTKIDTFNPKEFDVVKFAVKSKTLVNLNNIVSEKFDYVKTYDEYTPHMTIAYVKSGMGEKYIGNLKMPIFTSSSTFIYSYPGGKTDEFNYLQNK